jgi:hypothetical protein
MNIPMSNASKASLRNEWAHRTPLVVKAHIRMLNPRGANELEGVITVSAGGVAIVPELWCTR